MSDISLPVVPSIHKEARMALLILRCRWLMAPIFLGLASIFPMLIFKFCQTVYYNIQSLSSESLNETIVHILSMVEISLTGALVLLVMFSGYQNFVARIDLDAHSDKPTWMGHVRLGEIKLTLMASIVAISAIDLLQMFMNISTTSDRVLGWGVGIHVALVVSAVLLAFMDRLMGDKS